MSADSTLRVGRREWIGLAVLNLAAVVYAMDLTVLHLAVPSLSADLEPTSVQLLWIVDIYGFVVAVADHDGHARRSNRPAAAAAHRRHRVRRRVGSDCVLDERRDADRRPRAARRRRGVGGAVDAVADPEHVSRRGPAHVRNRGVGNELLGWRRHRPAARRRPARVLLVGLGLPAGGSSHGAATRAGTAAAARVPRSRTPAGSISSPRASR
jgi:hypothetical protein